MDSSSIKPARFYGRSLDGLHSERERRIEESRWRRPAEPRHEARSLLRPSPFKQQFWKQHEALAVAAEYSQDEDVLCCFVFQDENERRRFVVTYPEDFWEECENVPPEKRVFYEVIPENSPCFLYYDLEFEVDSNPNKNGVRMAQTLIDVTCEYIAKYWKYSCDRNSVINLDSSRRGKFSKHLIFSTKDFAFLNNNHVGQLVRLICSDLVNYFSAQQTHHDILDKFCTSDLEELFVETNKGQKLFIDLGVYTKNRHFRIYKATKWGKHSHLQKAPECQYSNTTKSKNRNLDIFLDSLISYLPKKKKLQLLSFDQDKKSQVISYSQLADKSLKQTFSTKEYPKSPYPMLDKYISELSSPGKIRDTKFIQTQQIIIYEIIGNRYCRNIGRWHKSNNIYLVVDIMNKIVYQKCHDEDCAGFTSTPKPLPDEVTFYFKDELDDLFINMNVYNSGN